MGWNNRQINASEAACILPLLGQVQAIHAKEHPDLYRVEYDKDGVLAWMQDWLSSDATTALGASTLEGQAVGYLIFEVEVRDPSPLAHLLPAIWHRP